MLAAVADVGSTSLGEVRCCRSASDGQLGYVDVVAGAGVGGEVAAADQNPDGIVVGGGAEAWSGDIGDGDGIAGAVGWRGTGSGFQFRAAAML